VRVTVTNVEALCRTLRSAVTMRDIAEEASLRGSLRATDMSFETDAGRVPGRDSSRKPPEDLRARSKRVDSPMALEALLGSRAGIAACGADRGGARLVGALVTGVGGCAAGRICTRVAPLRRSLPKISPGPPQV